MSRAAAVLVLGGIAAAAGAILWLVAAWVTSLAAYESIIGVDQPYSGETTHAYEVAGLTLLCVGIVIIIAGTGMLRAARFPRAEREPRAGSGPRPYP